MPPTDLAPTPDPAVSAIDRAEAAPRSVKPFVYAGLDVVFAVIYLLVGWSLARSAGGRFELASTALGVAAIAAAVGTASRRAWGWWVAACSLALLLVGATMLLALLALSAAFLEGVYGEFGRGAASMALIAAALVVELYALLPLFQLSWLLGATGRRHFGRP